MLTPLYVAQNLIGQFDEVPLAVDQTKPACCPPELRDVQFLSLRLTRDEGIVVCDVLVWPLGEGQDFPTCWCPPIYSLNIRAWIAVTADQLKQYLQSIIKHPDFIRWAVGD